MMKMIKLIKLSIENFKGVRNLDIEFNGKNTRISGKNGTGKTSIGDAISWLLFEKDMAGTAAIEIETKTPGGEVIHNLEHSVSAVFEIDGKTVKFQRKYLEKWTKKRGSATPEFSGHVSEFFTNDVPITKKEFDFKVSELGNADVLMSLMFTEIFTNLEWKTRREIFIDFVGGISDDEIIGKNEEFSSLQLDEYSIDEIKAMAMNNRKRINKELEALPGKISVLKNELTDIVADEEDIEKSIVTATRELSVLNTKKSNALSGGVVADYNIEISKLKKQYIDEEAARNQLIESQVSGARAAHRELQQKLIDTERLRDDKCDYLADLQKDKAMAEELLEKTRAKFRAEQSRVYDGSDICPCCGQVMPQKKINEAVSAFEKEKTEKLLAIREQGKQYGEDIKILTEKILATDCEIEKLTNGAIELNKALSEIIIPEFVPYENKEITDKIAAYEMKIQEANSGNSDIISEFDKEIEAKNKTISDLHKRLAHIKTQASIRSSIAELENQQASLGELLEVEDKKLYLVDEFTMMRCNMLTDKINSRFKNIRVKMFDVQVNGGIAPCCDIISTIDGSDLNKSMNRGQTVNAKIEIINALSEYYGLCVPVVIDDTEGVTKLAETVGQAIILRHDANTEELKIESEDK